MKKAITILFFLLAVRSNSIAQEYLWRDSIMYKLSIGTHDTSRVLLWSELSNYYKNVLPDSGLFYGYKALALARQIKFPKGEVNSLRSIIFSQTSLGNYSKALLANFEALKIAERNNLINDKALFLAVFGQIYHQLQDYTKALDWYKKSKAIFDSLHDYTLSALQQNFIGESYLLMNQLDSSLVYCQAAYENAVQLNVFWLEFEALLNLGKIQTKKGNHDIALACLRKAMSMGGEPRRFFETYFSTAKLYREMNNPDSSIYYAEESLKMIEDKGFYSGIISANLFLSDIYEKTNPQKAIEYSKVAMRYKDSLYHRGTTTSIENLMAFDEQERQYEIETAQANYRNRIKQYILIAGLLVFLLIAFLLYRNNKQKQKAKAKIEKAYEELKSTQAQLVQREKMASLGELTAGIAHEIQNPLNFVNNFSEVNHELFNEMEEELKEGNNVQALAIAKDIKENELKINFHGKRADAIVKGMLQHSRSSTGQKEPTDINGLADEYLRLAYHGTRAKDNSFNATIKTDFDESIGRINIIPHDIGRVLLNIFTNAFYAVSKKKAKNLNGYEPTVSLSTKNTPGKIQIRVFDNGIGIPEQVLDKIFQPFFTTKSTGEGTGLGLSISYDIMKLHGGEIQVKSVEGEYSEFIINLIG
jgi:signal transduction histidine kinase